MTREGFDVLVRKLENFSTKHPRLYIARIVGLVVLAYGYLLLILIGSFVLALLMIAMVIRVPATAKLAFIGLIAFGGIFWAVLRGLWVKLTPPTGHEITREQAPELFALLDELRAALDCRPFHKVLAVIANESRWIILKELAKGEPRMTIELARLIGSSPDATAKQMIMLRRAGLVEQVYGKLYTIPKKYLPVPGQPVVDFGHCLLRLDAA